MYIDSRVFIYQVFSPYSVVALAEFLFAALQLALDPPDVATIDRLLRIAICTPVSAPAIFRANHIGDTSIDRSA